MGDSRNYKWLTWDQGMKDKKVSRREDFPSALQHHVKKFMSKVVNCGIADIMMDSMYESITLLTALGMHKHDFRS